jgi:hypothetical protein
VTDPSQPIDSGNANLPVPVSGSSEPPQRLRLRAALEDRDSRLSLMYEAATRLIDDTDYPDRLSLAAHAMRELMEKLPAAFDLPLSQDFSIPNRMDHLEVAVRKARLESGCASTDGWEGEIDEPVAELLVSVESLVRDRRENLLSRKETATELMKRMEPGYVARTAALAKTDVDAWVKARRYFERVSHHHHTYESLKTDSTRFLERVREIETLLLGKLRPPAASDFAEIDDLMSAFIEGPDE